MAKGFVLSNFHMLQTARSRRLREKRGPGGKRGSTPPGAKDNVVTAKVQRGGR